MSESGVGLEWLKLIGVPDLVVTNPVGEPVVVPAAQPALVKAEPPPSETKLVPSPPVAVKEKDQVFVMDAPPKSVTPSAVLHEKEQIARANTPPMPVTPPVIVTPSSVPEKPAGMVVTKFVETEVVKKTESPVPSKSAEVVVTKVVETETKAEKKPESATSAKPAETVVTKVVEAVTKVEEPEPIKKTDTIPVLVSSKSQPALKSEVRTKPSVASFQTAPAEMPIRRDTHVVVIDPSTSKSTPPRLRDKIRKVFVKCGGDKLLRLMIGKPATNVAKAVVGRY